MILFINSYFLPSVDQVCRCINVVAKPDILLLYCEANIIRRKRRIPFKTATTYAKWNLGVRSLLRKQKYYILFTVNKMQHYTKKCNTLHEHITDMKENTW